jgi:hypothetical protein
MRVKYQADKGCPIASDIHSYQGHFPDRRRPDRSGLDTSHNAVWGKLPVGRPPTVQVSARAGSRGGDPTLLQLATTAHDSEAFC